MSQPKPLAAAVSVLLIIAGLLALGHYLLERHRDNDKAEMIARDVERLMRRLEQDDLDGIEKAYEAMAQEVESLRRVPPALEKRLADLKSTILRLQHERRTPHAPAPMPRERDPAPSRR